MSISRPRPAVPLYKRLPTHITGRDAGFISRAIGLLIDQAIVGLAAIGLFLVVRSLLSIGGMNMENCTAFVSTDSFRSLLVNICRLVGGVTTIASIMIGPAYYVIFWIFGGQTIGMAATGVRVVNSRGTGISLGQSLRRLIGYMICIITLGLGFLAVIWNPRRQGWHDRLANTYVVYTWKHAPVPPMKASLTPIPAHAHIDESNKAATRPSAGAPVSD